MHIDSATHKTISPLAEPLSVALIGTGNRSKTTYRPLFDYLKPWIRITAVCDPVRESADAFAEDLGVPAFYDLHELIRARPMEAAFVVSPIPSHHSICCTLLAHGVPVNVETSMCNLLLQAQEMVAAARRHKTILRIAENFFRFPFDRMMKVIAADGFIGEVKRLTCWHDHTGFHNNSRWIHFFGAQPLAVQAITHEMPTVGHYQLAHRYHETEKYRAHFYWFPDDALVVDHAGNIKSMLGRYPRPGYTELAGARGAIVQQAAAGWHGQGEVRYCTDAALANGGRHDLSYPIVHVGDGRDWLSSHVDLPDRRIEVVNPYRLGASAYHRRNYYSAAVIGHIVDFAEAVRGIRESEYTDEDALMAMMMEVATRESTLQNGKRLQLPLTGELESEVALRASLREEYGVDPLDIEAMLAISYPRP
ncbi:MAG: Gfo/Idh/MocA family oxidoreductase [Chloroflexi bacterium]|nr:Gfo/Idh/MocA family oxidoreductase [Chloroflexota bacterium]MCY3582318.1 Gfo/Idh/MocA family oxidoreductase [Chloroflexota bacterium]MCY3717891.1 Gfo/Idh/MocA family oxidoreductase [Chloroflexota bacterium]MDE2649101.1 Gfo/Idh/MocA family oxidoreductase [Chloroflexota bacterium]